MILCSSEVCDVISGSASSLDDEAGCSAEMKRLIERDKSDEYPH